MIDRNKMGKIKINTHEVLRFVKIAGVLAAVFLFPKGMSTLAKEGLIERFIYPEDFKEDLSEKKEKKKKDYRLSRLKYLIKRLKKQKDIKLVKENGKVALKLTEKGRIKLLRYDLKNLKLKKPEKWDGKWRLIIYDVPENKKVSRVILRRYLRSLDFLPLQKSVYLTPYQCEEEVELLRSYYDIIDDVVLLTVTGIEQEEAYKKYFKLL